MGRHMRNVAARCNLLKLAAREQGVTRQEAIASDDIKLCESGIDAMLRQMRSRRLIAYREEVVERAVGLTNVGGWARRPVRVYRVTPKGASCPGLAHNGDAHNQPGNSDSPGACPTSATLGTTTEPCW